MINHLGVVIFQKISFPQRDEPFLSMVKTNEGRLLQSRPKKGYTFGFVKVWISLLFAGPIYVNGQRSP